MTVPKTSVLASGGVTGRLPEEEEAAKEAARRAAAAPFEMVNVTGPDGRPMTVPKSSILAIGGVAGRTPEEEKVAEKKAVSALEKQQLLPKAQANLLTIERKSKDILNKTDTILKQIEEPLTTGLKGAALGNIPGTAAFDLRANLETVLANVGFDELQAMRDASPTGGALGQVAVKEIELLQAIRGNLSANQSYAQLKKNLEDFRKNMAMLQEERRRAFRADFGRDPEGAGSGFKILNVRD